MDPDVERLAQVIWDYHRLDHTLEPSDCILTLCSHDPRVAVHAAELYLAGWAPLLIFSGNVGALTAGLYDRPEADYFAEIARAHGVPADAILIENRATNTGENVRFTRQLLADASLDPQRFLLVQKPFMERRAYATFRAVWPEKSVIVTSPPIAFTAYATPEFPLDRIVSIMVGDLQRIQVYPARGFQIEQEIPREVMHAFEKLVQLGYDGHLLTAAKG